MSILIKNMTMPETCEDCPLQHSEYLECKITGENTWDWENAEAKYKSVNCPLVELPPHGRLIDADVAEVITYTTEDGDFADGILYAADWIASQQTVIEADDTIKTPLFDIVEEHDHCHVQVLRNSITGEVSVGWWEEKE